MPTTSGPKWGKNSGPSTGPNFTPPKPPSVFQKVVRIAEAPAVLTGNLLTDVKDAVVGLPMGLVGTVQHPKRAAYAIKDTTWHTWSPLFHGDFQKFAKQTYDHPLAPLLDVASVLSLGLGTAAKGASLSIGVTGTARIADKISLAGPKTLAATLPLTRTEKLASLRLGKTHTLNDPAMIKQPVDKYLSRRPLRRLSQEGMIRLEQNGHLPNFYVKARFNRAHLVDVSHRYVAAQATEVAAIRQADAIETGDHLIQKLPNLEHDALVEAITMQTHFTVRAARALADITDVGRRARTAVAMGMHTNLVRFNKAFAPDEAQRLVDAGHNSFVVDPAFIDKGHTQLVRRSQRLHSSATRKASKFETDNAVREARLREKQKRYSAEAQGLARTESDLAKANERLNELDRAGKTVQGGARDAKNRVIQNPTQRQLDKYSSEEVQALHETITKLTKQRESALVAQKRADSYDASLQNIANARQAKQAKVLEAHERMNALADRSTADHFAHAAESQEALIAYAQKFGSQATTKNIEHALRDSNGNIYVANKHDAYNLGIEGEASLHALHVILHHPTLWWKRLTIGYTPRTITNNGVGNWFMYAVSAAGPRGIAAMGRALQYQFGHKVLHNTDDLGDVLFEDSNVITRNHQDVLADQYGAGQEIRKVGSSTIHHTKKDKAKAVLSQGFYPLVRDTSETPVKIASLYNTYLGFDEVKLALKEAKASGLRGQKAVDKAIQSAIDRHPSLQGEASLQARRVAGDYVTMNGAEKWMRDLIPFYLWDRHILKHVGNTVAETPGRAALGFKLSDYGLDETEKLVGELPDFLKGAIPLRALGFSDKPGRLNFLTTASLNPYASAGELADTVNAWALGGGPRRSAALSQANPFVVGTAESIFQTSALTGVPTPHTGSIIGDVVKRNVQGLPYAKAYTEFTSPDRFQSPKGNDYAFAKTNKAVITSLFGVPLKDASKKRLADLAAREANK